MSESQDNVIRLKDRADATLLECLGTVRYMQACTLMAEVELLVADLEPPEAALALSTFNSLVALRYAEQRRGRDG